MIYVSRELFYCFLLISMDTNSYSVFASFTGILVWAFDYPVGISAIFWGWETMLSQVQAALLPQHWSTGLHGGNRCIKLCTLLWRWGDKSMHYLHIYELYDISSLEGEGWEVVVLWWLFQCISWGNPRHGYRRLCWAQNKLPIGRYCYRGRRRLVAPGWSRIRGNAANTMQGTLLNSMHR